MRRACLLTVALVLGALIAGTAAADRDPGVHALVGARIVTAPGQVVESGTLVMRRGIIEAVGADITPPADARIWDVEGLTLYPGLIESFYPIEIPNPEGAEPSTVGHDNALVQPERRAAEHVDTSVFKKLHQAGFTSAVLVPKSGLFRGMSSLVNLGDGPVGSQILRDEVAHNGQFALDSDGGYPSSLMGAIALFRQTLYDARWHRAAHRAFEKNPRQARPELNTAWQALEGVAAGEERIVLQSDNVNDAERLIRLAEAFELDAVLVGSGKEYRHAERLVTGEKTWILPAKYPDTPKVDAEHPEKADLEALRHWDAAPGNISALLDAGAEVALTSLGHADPKQLHKHLARSVAEGLDADRALAALTTVPAALWGIADRAGTLEKGKMANLVVVDGELFVESPKLTALWIDGRRLELQELKPPTVDPIGTWDLIIDAGQGGQIPVSVKLTGSVDDMSGTVSALGGSLPLTEAVVSDDTVRLAMDSSAIGMPGTITFNLTIEGDSCSGDGTSPQGPFEVSGTRTAGPAPEVLQ